MSKKKVAVIAAIAAVALLAGVGAYAASSFGTKDDPLVAMSYLDDTLSPAILDELQGELDEAIGMLESELGYTADTYKVVTLSKGQTVTGSVGCEVILRIGSATCAASDSPGLVDTTDGSSINNGTALTVNHLYMVSIAGNGFKAASDNTKVLIRGSYTIG